MIVNRILYATLLCKFDLQLNGAILSLMAAGGNKLASWLGVAGAGLLLGGGLGAVVGTLVGACIGVAVMYQIVTDDIHVADRATESIVGFVGILSFALYGLILGLIGGLIWGSATAILGKLIYDARKQPPRIRQ